MAHGSIVDAGTNGMSGTDFFAKFYFADRQLADGYAGFGMRVRSAFEDRADACSRARTRGLIGKCNLLLHSMGTGIHAKLNGSGCSLGISRLLQGRLQPSILSGINWAVLQEV